ncbi:hypothetical protein M378DRAFT_12038 [Amanita muscaria Koide BX008]|uniref:Uncharacterized protein n=1 Tax=Amanita muscaria (strain Koide BX008) TaxID=946122 RepID=A0A0C2TA98_AMAMK|nr:hypothetical protein M378DRAFT_12038 [Amanita muscaria Koide BX008]
MDSIDDPRSSHSMSNGFGSMTAVVARSSFVPASSVYPGISQLRLVCRNNSRKPVTDSLFLMSDSFGSTKIAVQASCSPLASFLALASFVWSEEQASLLDYLVNILFLLEIPPGTGRNHDVAGLVPTPIPPSNEPPIYIPNVMTRTSLDNPDLFRLEIDL